MVDRDGLSIEEIFEKEEHVELIDGEIVITDFTSSEHNNAVLEIATAFKFYIKEHDGKCQVRTDTVLLYCDEILEQDERNRFEPDVMVVCEPEGIKSDGVHVAPLFVAEVTSPSTRKNDFGIKAYIYGQMGVREYWVVDLQNTSVTVYRADNDFAPETYLHCDKLNVSVYENLEIDFSSIF